MKDMPDRPIFELSRLVEYSDEAIIVELRRVAKLIPNETLTVAKFERLGRVAPNTVRRRFGSWFKALEKAELAPVSTNKVRTKGGHASRQMTDDDVLRRLRDLAVRLGRNELTKADVNQNLPFSDEILRKRWGTLRAAFAAAGLSTTPLGRRYSDEECFDNMLAVWTHYGRSPMHREMAKPPSTVGAKAYIKRFGTWNKTLAAFVERVNQDEQPDKTQDSVPLVTETLGSPSEPVDVPPLKLEDRRDVPLGLRFRILSRDRFKCVLCGDHPARTATCVLHVDHIVPWSRGGKTSEDNLRTLCATCNVGRGNRFTD